MKHEPLPVQFHIKQPYLITQMHLNYNCLGSKERCECTTKFVCLFVQISVSELNLHTSTDIYECTTKFAYLTDVLLRRVK